MESQPGGVVPLPPDVLFRRRAQRRGLAGWLAGGAPALPLTVIHEACLVNDNAGWGGRPGGKVV